jgi:putative nucleotidyltransferase with HDIG domain
MTMNSSNKSPRSRSSRPERPSLRSNKYAPFGSMSTRPPTSPAPASLAARNSSVHKPSSASVAIDEDLWFGAHDHAVAEDAAARSMAALVGRIIGAKPFPVTARRLADLTRQDVVRIEPVIQVLESDPGLSARLLRLVNSAGYALRQRCTSVRHAATLVGTDRLHQIATTAAVLDLFDSKGPVAAQIIEHSTVVGAFCRYLGAHLALPVDDLFTAGFLHDIGKLMLMETENEQYVELLSKCGSSPDTIHHLERALYGFDHAVLAAHVLSAWNIPDPVPKIVAWHHEPTHAYKVSSMMAALVQTVRLADALVYVMQSAPEQPNIKEMAQHEAASYLDISEPQLAAMWDELQVLFNESREQCLGENAPALDPRSLRPRRPLNLSVEPTPSERAHELPKQFPCVECGCPTFGNTCPACGGYVCPDHQVGRDAWCAVCARDYRVEKSSLPVPVPAKWAFGIVSSAVAISGVAGMISAGSTGALRAGFGTLLLGTLVTLLYVVGKHWFIRARFVRTRPNRFIAEPLLNDGGTQSLVPPDFPGPSQSEAQVRAVAGVTARLVEPLKEIAIREISGQDYDSAQTLPIADRARASGGNLSSNSEKAWESPDSNRVRLQSHSLVTLPVPPMHSPLQEAVVAESSPTLADDPRRVPRDTLLERGRTSQPEFDHGGGDNAANSAQPESESSRDVSGQNSGASAILADEHVEAQRDTLYGPEFERPSQADATLVSEAESPNIAGNRDCGETVRPMPTIEVVAEPSRDLNASGSVAQDHPRSKEPGERPSASELGKRGSKVVSVHPLAALGLRSQAPPHTTLPAASNDDDATNHNASGSSDTNELADAQPAQVLQAAPEPQAPPEVPQGESNDSGLIESLVERSGPRFGEEFEARVRELVAQRVAEIVAERMLQAFLGGMASPQYAHGRAAGRRSRNATAGRIDPQASLEDKPKAKARRRTKQQQSG